ncbi:hypothetical protein C0R04_29155 [Streptomyces albidoflavus]|nr:hypothetical protein C0R04_29155 [Streptomyces albidoflavus]RZE87925.1 hypothetical protein C0R03_29165 [Streptomyces albidoflavus]
MSPSPPAGRRGAAPPWPGAACPAAARTGSPAPGRRRGGRPRRRPRASRRPPAPAAGSPGR